VFFADRDGQVQLARAPALRPEALAAVQQQVRRRVLRWFARAGHLDAADARTQLRLTPLELIVRLAA
jgi:hypothetical protein